MLNIYTVTLLFVASIAFILFETIDIALSTILSLNTLIICIGLYISIQKKIINIDLIYWIFNFLFFIIAVVVQSKGSYFPTRLPVDIDNVILGQILILIWNFIFIVFRNRNFTSSKTMKNLVISENISNIYFLISTIFCLYIFLRNGMDYFYGYGSIITNNDSQPIQLLVSTTVNGIVFSNFIFLYARRNKEDVINKIFIGIAFLQLIYIMNPFNTNRFNLGFIIIFFLWYFYRNKISAYKFAIIFLMGMIVIFPFIDVFRYGFNNEFTFSFDNSFDQFKELHFDAFANFLASIEYVKEKSLLLGGNFWGALLFFIPSSFWSSKPEGSGTRIGDYLIENYNFHFNNLSNPLISEFYLGFGVIGIIIGAFVFALILNKIEYYSKRSPNNEIVYGVILSYLLILLRGSLIVAFSSIVGSIFFLILLPKLLMIKQQKTNKLNNSNLDWG